MGKTGKPLTLESPAMVDNSGKSCLTRRSVADYY